MTPRLRGAPGPMGGGRGGGGGGGFNRSAPYDSRDRYGGMNRYNMGRGRSGK